MTSCNSAGISLHKRLASARALAYKPLNSSVGVQTRCYRTKHAGLLARFFIVRPECQI